MTFRSIKDLLRRPIPDEVIDRADELELNKVFIAARHAKECPLCMSKVREFETRIIDEMYQHALESER